MSTETTLTAYYDGACPLCRREVAFLRGRDRAGAVRWVDVSASPADPGPDLRRSCALARFHVRRADGSLLCGARGFVEVWRTTLGWGRLADLLATRALVDALEGAYRLFLRVRPPLQRLAARLECEPRTPGSDRAEER